MTKILLYIIIYIDMLKLIIIIKYNNFLWLKNKNKNRRILGKKMNKVMLHASLRWQNLLII